VGNYRLALGSRIIEALDSRAKSAGLALLIGLLFGALQLAIPNRSRFVVPFVINAAGGTIVSYLLLVGARARRLAVLEHIRKVAELNHNVRNALTVISATQYLTAEMAEHDRKMMMESVERINTTLRHLFPVVGERKADRTMRIQNDARRGTPDRRRGSDRRSVR